MIIEGNNVIWVSQVALVVKNPPADIGDIKRCGFDPWVEKMPWRRKWQPTVVFLPGKLHGHRSLAGYSPWGRKELDMTEATYGEGNGTPLQYSCLENLLDRGAW